MIIDYTNSGLYRSATVESLAGQVGRKCNYVLPSCGAFFSKNTVVQANLTQCGISGFVLNTWITLEHGKDYVFGLPFNDAIAKTGKAVYGAIVIFDEKAIGSLRVTTNALSPDYALPYGVRQNALLSGRFNPLYAQYEDLYDFSSIAKSTQPKEEPLMYTDLCKAISTFTQGATGYPEYSWIKHSKHIKSNLNEHRVTKSQLGLPLIPNYPLATTADVAAGTSTSMLLTPQLAFAAINTLEGVYPLRNLNNGQEPDSQTNANSVLTAAGAHYLLATSGTVLSNPSMLKVKKYVLASGKINYPMQVNGIFCANFRAIIDTVSQYSGYNVLSYNESEQAIYSTDKLSLPPDAVPSFSPATVPIPSSIAPTNIDVEPLKGFSYGQYVTAYSTGGVISFGIFDGQGITVRPFQSANGLMGWTGGSYGRIQRIVASSDGGFYLLGYKDAFVDPVSLVSGNWLVAQKYSRYGQLVKEICFGKNHTAIYNAGKIARINAVTISSVEYLLGCYTLTRVADSLPTVRAWIYNTTSNAAYDAELFVGDTTSDTVTDFKFSINALNAQACFCASFANNTFRSGAVTIATGIVTNTARYTASGTTSTHGTLRVCATLDGGWLVGLVLGSTGQSYYLLSSLGAQLATLAVASGSGGISRMGDFICGSNGFIAIPFSYASGGQWYPGLHVVNAQSSTLAFVNRWDAGLTTNIYGNSYYGLNALVTAPSAPPVVWSTVGGWDSGTTAFTGYVAYDDVTGYLGDPNSVNGGYLKISYLLATGYATVATVSTGPARIAGSLGHVKPVSKADGAWSGAFLSAFQVYTDYTLKTPSITTGYLPN